MINDIAPRRFDNCYKNKKAEPHDLFLSYEGNTVLVKKDKDKLWYPSFKDYEEDFPGLAENATFLFTVDDINYYLVEERS